MEAAILCRHVSTEALNSFPAIDEISRQSRENASPPMTSISVFPQYRYYPLLFRNFLNPEVLPSGKLLHVRVCFKHRSEWDLYEKSVTKMELSQLFAQNVVFFAKTYPYSKADYKRTTEGRMKGFLFESRGSVLSFDILYVYIFEEEHFLEGIKLW